MFAADFKYWLLEDNKKQSVAMVAAHYGTLPVEYAHWDHVCANGETLAHIAARAGKLPEAIRRSRRIMELRNKHGVSVESLVSTKGTSELQKCLNLLQGRR